MADADHAVATEVIAQPVHHDLLRGARIGRRALVEAALVQRLAGAVLGLQPRLAEHLTVRIQRIGHAVRVEEQPFAGGQAQGLAPVGKALDHPKRRLAARKGQRPGLAARRPRNSGVAADCAIRAFKPKRINFSYFMRKTAMTKAPHPPEPYR